MAKFCPVCGSKLDDQGVCSNARCPMAKLTKKANSAAASAEKARAAAEKAQDQERAAQREEFLSAQQAQKETLGINKDWEQ